MEKLSPKIIQKIAKTSESATSQLMSKKDSQHESVTFRKLPPVLLSYQREYFKKACSSSVLVVEKSRRIGISWADSAVAALDASKKNGCSTYYISYNKESTEQYILDAVFWAKAYHLAATSIEELILKDIDKDILIYRIRFASGYQVMALSSAPTNLRNKKGVIVVDEAAWQENLEAVINAAMGVVMWGGRVRIMSTHHGVDHDFNALCKGIRAGTLPYQLMRIPFQEAISQGLYKRIALCNGWVYSAESEAKWVHDTYKRYGNSAPEELDCEPLESGGGLLSLDYFRRYSRLPHRFELVVLSFDTASKNNETSSAWGCLAIGVFEDEFYIFDAIVERMEYPTGKSRCFSWALHHNPNFILIEDKSTGQTLIQDFRLGVKTPNGATRKFNVLPITPSADKATRMNVESGAVQSGRVWLPESAEWLPQLEISFRQFPKGLSDPVDALSQFLKWHRESNSVPLEAHGASYSRLNKKLWSD